MVKAATTITTALVNKDPANASTYLANAAALTQELTDLDRTLEAQMKPVSGMKYLVAHDSYSHFAERYGLQEAITLSPGGEQTPGAAKIAELRERIKTENITCLLREPASSSRLIATLTEGNTVKVEIADPLARGIEAGPDLYTKALTAIGNAFANCFKS